MTTVDRSDDFWNILLIVVFPGISAAVLLVAPSLVGEMVSGLGLSPSQAGFIISVELGGMSLATVPAYFWINRVDIRRAAALAVVVSIVGNLLTARETEYGPILVCRAITALANGSLMVICFNIMKNMKNRDRAFGFHVIGQLVLGAIGVAVLPHLFEISGLYIAFVILAVLMAASSPLIRFFPRYLSFDSKPIDEKAVPNGFLLGSFGVLGVFLFYVALGGVWTYVERIGVTAGFESASIGYILSIATVFGILGAVIATTMGGRVSHFSPIVVGMAIMSSSVFLFHGLDTFVVFVIAACLFKFAWTFVLPFLLGNVAKVDSTGRLVTTMYLLITTALSIGPAIAAVIIGQSESYDRVIIFSLIVLLLSSVIVVSVAKTTRQIRS